MNYLRRQYGRHTVDNLVKSLITVCRDLRALVDHLAESTSEPDSSDATTVREIACRYTEAYRKICIKTSIGSTGTHDEQKMAIAEGVIPLLSVWSYTTK